MASAFVLGTTLGALTTGIACALLAATWTWILPPLVQGAVLVAVGALLLLHEFGWITLPLPQRSIQIEQSVLSRASGLQAMRFGYELGLSFRTYVPSVAPYLLLVAVSIGFLGFAESIAVATVYGVARGTSAFYRVAFRRRVLASVWDSPWPARLASTTTVVILTALVVTRSIA